MKCKNCGIIKGFHDNSMVMYLNGNCKQFTPSEPKKYMSTNISSSGEEIKENKGCGKLYFNGKRICGERNLCPSCSDNSSLKVLRENTSKWKTEEIKRLRKEIEDNHNSQCADNSDKVTKEPVRQRINNASSGSDFKLSDKIVEFDSFCDFKGFEEKDVKEFILRLKEELDNKTKECLSGHIAIINLLIDKLSGFKDA